MPDKDTHVGLRQVLLVEDHSDTREITGRILSRHGYLVHAAANAEEALKLASASVCDVALIDIGLPDIDGMNLLTRLREIRPILAIAFTAYVMAHQIEEYHASGFDAVVAKPISVQDLLLVMERLLTAKLESCPMPRVLIVDDESVHRVLLGKHFVDAGYKVNFAGNGWEALIALRRDKVDLILCAVVMPGFGGVVLIEMMQEEHQTEAPPVVVLIGPTDDVGQLVGLDIAAVIPKGQDRLDETLKTAEAVLEGRGK